MRLSEIRRTEAHNQREQDEVCSAMNTDELKAELNGEELCPHRRAYLEGRLKSLKNEERWIRRKIQQAKFNGQLSDVLVKGDFKVKRTGDKMIKLQDLNNGLSLCLRKKDRKKITLDVSTPVQIY